jgi:arylsulfatase A-like enzyme
MAKWLVLIICALSVSFCTTGAAAPPIGVVLITLDTTRADRLTAYGFADASMPHLERLAREGVVFEQAVSVAPLTVPAHASLLTGLLPPGHGVRENSSPPLAPEHTTLAEVLRGHGFRSAAMVSSGVLDPDRGLAQGFDSYSAVQGGRRPRPDAPQRKAEAAIGEAIDWLDLVGDSRFFLWTHLYDPHRPYEPPEPFASRYAHDPYVGEIAYADSQIGRLLGALDRHGLLERTLVIVAGDHGESLGEHGERDHGIFVYEAVLRVPLIIRLPAVEARRVQAVVRLTDVMPTVLDLLGLPSPPTYGASLTRLMRGEPQEELESYAESLYPRRFGWSPLYSLRDSRFKLIDAPRPELYDLQQDPWEQRNLYDDRPATAAALRRRLSSIRAAVPSSDAHSLEVVPPEIRERLAALGYVSGGTGDTSTGDTGLRDAKDFIRENWTPPAGRGPSPIPDR